MDIMEDPPLWQHFVHSLSHDGRVVVALELLDSVSDIEDTVLLSLDLSYRQHFHHEAPEICLSTCRWAGKVIYTICCLAVQRQHDEKALELLIAQMGEVETASHHYSVDIWFHVFPELLNIIRLKSHDDPLIASISKLCDLFPMSSLGTGFENVESLDLTPICENKSLLFFFTDRMLIHEEWKWLACDSVRSRVNTIIGDHYHNFQPIVKALKEYDQSTRTDNFSDTAKAGS